MNRKLKKLLKSYSFEIILFFLLLSGFFLLIVDVDLKQNIGILINLILDTLRNTFYFITHNVYDGFRIVKFSNLLGFLILLLGFYLTLKRWKNRLLRFNNSSKICEKCNSKINRIKKSNHLRFLGFILRLKIRIYKCEECNIKVKVYRTR